jgi:hypothetical protein
MEQAYRVLEQVDDHLAPYPSGNAGYKIRKQF